MALTPLLATLGSKIAEMIDKGDGKTPLQIIQNNARDLTNHIIIAGFGKVGKMVARVLAAEGINYIVLDLNHNLVSDESNNGIPIFVGDISQLETLKAIYAERSAGIVLTMNNAITIKKTLKTINSHYEDRNIIVRLKNLKNASEFYDIGANIIIPEDYETGLQLAGATLKSIGITEAEINRLKDQFRSGNYTVAKQDYNDPEDSE